MTVLAYKDGVLCSDSRATVLETILTDKCKKVTKGPGVIGGNSGDATDLRVFFEWVEAGADLKKIPRGKYWGIVVYKQLKGLPRVFRLEDGGYLELLLEKGEFVTAGSGREIAMGALAVGATPEEAVAATIRHSQACGGAIQKVSL